MISELCGLKMLQFPPHRRAWRRETCFLVKVRKSSFIWSLDPAWSSLLLTCWCHEVDDVLQGGAELPLLILLQSEVQCSEDHHPELGHSLKQNKIWEHTLCHSDHIQECATFYRSSPLAVSWWYWSHFCAINFNWSSIVRQGSNDNSSARLGQIQHRAAIWQRAECCAPFDWSLLLLSWIKL